MTRKPTVHPALQAPTASTPLREKSPRAVPPLPTEAAPPKRSLDNVQMLLDAADDAVTEVDVKVAAPVGVVRNEAGEEATETADAVQDASRRAALAARRV